MSRIVTLRLDDEVYEELKEAAASQRRPLSNLIENAALQKVREERFLDDAEMSEIARNAPLSARLRKGSRDALKRKGRFVE